MGRAPGTDCTLRFMGRAGTGYGLHFATNSRRQRWIPTCTLCFVGGTRTRFHLHLATTCWNRHRAQVATCDQRSGPVLDIGCKLRPGVETSTGYRLYAATPCWDWYRVEVARCDQLLELAQCISIRCKLWPMVGAGTVSKLQVARPVRRRSRVGMHRTVRGCLAKFM